MTSPAATAEPTSRSRAFAVLIMLFLFQTLNFFDKLVFGLSAVPMMKELALTPQQFGLIGSSFFLLFSLSGMAVGLVVIGAEVDDDYVVRGPGEWVWPPGRTDQWGIAPPKAEHVKAAQVAVPYATET